MQWIKDNNKGSEKEAQVFFYILFNRLLMPSSDSNLTGENILCGDLEKIGTINWSKVICKHLKEGIIKRRERKKKASREDNMWVPHTSYLIPHLIVLKPNKELGRTYSYQPNTEKSPTQLKRLDRAQPIPYDPRTKHTIK